MSIDTNADNPQPTLAAMTPEKIEQGRKLLAKIGPEMWIADQPDNWHGLAARVYISEPYGLVATVPISGWRPKSRAVAFSETIAWLRNNAPAILAAAELGMAWEAEGKATREWIARGAHLDKELDLRSGSLYMVMIAARSKTDQLTGRIGLQS